MMISDKVKKKQAHCWQDYEEFEAEEHGFGSDEYMFAYNHPSTCLLKAGHKGKHRWTSDSGITIRFKGAKK